MGYTPALLSVWVGRVGRVGSSIDCDSAPATCKTVVNCSELCRRCNKGQSLGISLMELNSLHCVAGARVIEGRYMFQFGCSRCTSPNLGYSQPGSVRFPLGVCAVKKIRKIFTIDFLFAIILYLTLYNTFPHKYSIVIWQLASWLTNWFWITVLFHSCFVFSFLEWLYPSGGGEENVESAALGILILWTTWWEKGGEREREGGRDGERERERGGRKRERDRQK